MHSAEQRLAAGAGRDRKRTPGGTLPSLRLRGRRGPRAEGHAHAREVRAPGDLRASRRDVEVHRVAEVAALRAAVHRQLVLVQVERLGAGGPQHPQGSADAAEGRERLRPAAPGTAAGPGRHRRPPGRLLTGERDPRWGTAGVAAGGPPMPAARLGARGVSVRGDSPGSAARPLRSAPRRLPARSRPAPLGGWPRASCPPRAAGGAGALAAPPSGGSGAARGSPRLRGLPSPCWQPAPGACFGSWFSITVASQGRPESCACQCEPLLLEGMLPARGESFLQFVPKGRRWERTPPRGKRKRPLCVASAV